MEEKLRHVASCPFLEIETLWLPLSCKVTVPSHHWKSQFLGWHGLAGLLTGPKVKHLQSDGTFPQGLGMGSEKLTQWFPEIRPALLKQTSTESEDQDSWQSEGNKGERAMSPMLKLTFGSVTSLPAKGLVYHPVHNWACKVG